MSSAELIREQWFFEDPRGLTEWNTYGSRMDRLQEEVDETKVALDEESRMAFFMEIADVIIFSHSILGAICRELDIEPEAVDHLIMAKVHQNQEKYPERLFINNSPEEAIRIAREEWKGAHE